MRKSLLSRALPAVIPPLLALILVMLGVGIHIYIAVLLGYVVLLVIIMSAICDNTRLVIARTVLHFIFAMACIVAYTLSRM